MDARSLISTMAHVSTVRPPQTLRTASPTTAGGGQPAIDGVSVPSGWRA